MQANLMNWKNTLKEKPLFGCFVTYPLADLAELTAAIGFDFIVIDNEHGIMTHNTLADMVRASQAVGVPAVVRCTYNNYEHVQKALDMGANGVQVPLVNTAEDAKRLVQLANFAPVGRRGTAYLPRAASYGMIQDKCAYRAEANRVKATIAHIETMEAVDNLDNILKVDGIDVFFIGPGDLSSSMNLPGDDPRVKRQIRNCIEKITAAGRIAGTYVGTPEATQEAMGWGARYFITAINSYMISGGKAYLQAVRQQGGR